MEVLIIGEGSLQLNNLARDMENSQSFAILVENWRRFGQYLGVTDVDLLGLERKLRASDVELRSIHREILKIWIAKTGSGANLKILHDALVKCSLRDMAELLMSTYIFKTNSVMSDGKSTALNNLVGENISNSVICLSDYYKLKATNLLNECHAEYRKIMKLDINELIRTEQDLSAFHDKTKQQVVEIFRNRCPVQNSSFKESYLGQLEEKISESFKEFLENCKIKNSLEDAKTLVMLMECRQQYLAELERQYKSKCFIRSKRMQALHNRTTEIVLQKFGKGITKAQEENLMKEMQVQFEILKTKNGTTFNWIMDQGAITRYCTPKLASIVLIILIASIPESFLKSSENRQPRNCQDIQKTKDGIFRYAPSGSYNIYVENGLNRSIEVWCDMHTDGGGWIVIQSRFCDSSDILHNFADFKKSWAEYAEGFGSFHNFWLGLDTIHAITKRDNYTLRVDLMSQSGEKRYAEYRVFRVANSSDMYRLHVGGYRGDAGDSLSSDNGNPFSTYDRDNRDPNGGECSDTNGGGWWSGECNLSNLNGICPWGIMKALFPLPWHSESHGIGLNWPSWKGHRYSFRSAEMKIRTTDLIVTDWTGMTDLSKLGEQIEYLVMRCKNSMLTIRNVVRSVINL